MPVIPFQHFACPLDGKPLRRHGAIWRCGVGHSFDVAGSGHINLLPVQNKRSRDPGDSKEMVAARRRFLETGAYAPIAEAVSRAALARPTATFALLDAGCGEGYYLKQIAAAAGGEQTLALVGLDISKWAAIAAAKDDRERRFGWLVGSNANLPILPKTLDGVLCMFGFPVYAEFARVLRPGGILLQVDAGPEHLRELREIIYPSLKPERPAATQTPAGFTDVSTESVRYSLALTERQQIADLLAMTPHLYRIGAEGRARAEALDALTLTVDVRLRLLERSAAVR